MIVSNEEQSTLVSRWRGRSSLAQPLHLANTERACSPGSMVVLKLEERQNGFRQKIYFVQIPWRPLNLGGTHTTRSSRRPLRKEHLGEQVLKMN